MHTNVNKDANRVSSRTTQTRAYNKAAKVGKYHCVSFRFPGPMV